MTSTKQSRELAYGRRMLHGIARLLWKLPSPTVEESEAAIHAHDQQELEAVKFVLTERAKVLGAGYEALMSGDFALEREELFNLATTDLFVEKAQRVLTQRADDLWSGGMWALRAVIGVLVIAASITTVFIWKGPQPDVGTSWQLMVVTIFGSISLAGVFFAVAKFLISISRAMFHESQVLRDRRDAYRFGRMGVYLARGEISFSELEGIFKWNAADVTAFLDISPEILMSTPITQMFQRALDLPAEQFAEFLTSAVTGRPARPRRRLRRERLAD